MSKSWKIILYFVDKSTKEVNLKATLKTKRIEESRARELAKAEQAKSENCVAWELK